MNTDEKQSDQQPVEPEVLDNTALVNTGQAAPVTIDDYAASEQHLQRLERGIQVIKVLRRASIALTYPHDWILFKAEDRITAYLQDVGVQRVWDLWGIEQYDLGEFERTDDKETGDFAMSITGSARCARTGQDLKGVTGTRYSYEEFIVRRKLNRLQVEPEVRKAARANLDGNLGRELMALKSVPVEELDEVWQGAGMTWKSSRLCPKGRGFGSAAERTGGLGQSEVMPDQEPICDACVVAGKTTKMKFKAAGVSQGGRKYDAFWSCPVNRDHKTLQHAELLKRLPKPESKREPGDEPHE